MTDMTKPDFRCRVCGQDVIVAPVDGLGICPACCVRTDEGHDYQYDRDMRGYFCFHCGAQAPDDYALDSG